MSTICIIPARGGSRRIPRKNIRLFHGKPIIAYSIETAKACGLFDEVYVSTDDDEIEEIAIDYGALVYRRDPALCEDHIGTQEVGKAFYEEIDQDGMIDEMCLIYPTAPMLEVSDLRDSYRFLLSNEPMFLFSVGTQPLCDAGVFYWGKSWAWAYGKELITPRSAMWPMPPNRVCDINTEDDWTRAEQMYANLYGING